MASDIWLRTILIVRKETRCHHIGYSYRLTARVLLYAPSHRCKGRKEMIYLTTHSAHFIYGYMASDIMIIYGKGNVKWNEMFYLTMHSTHFIYGYMASDIWLRTILIVSASLNKTFLSLHTLQAPYKHQTFVSIFLSFFLYLFIFLFIYLFIYLFVCVCGYI